MPIVFLPGLEAAAAAIFALLGLLALSYFVKWVASAMPGRGVPVLGRLFSFVIAAAGRVLSSVGGELDAVMGALGRVVAYPIVVAMGLINRGMDALDEVVTTTGWILGTAIPRAIRAAEHAIYHAISQIKANLWKGIHGAEHLARVLAAHTLAHALHRLSQLSSNVWKGVHGAEALARRLTANLAKVVASDLVAAKAFTRTYVKATVQSINGDIANIKGLISASLGTAEKYTDSAISNLAKSVPVTATAAATGLISDLDQEVTSALAGAWPTVKDNIGVLDGLIGQGLPNIRTWLDEINLSKVGDVAGAAALTGVLSNVLTRYLRDCGIPNCRNLSAFGRDLQGLLGLVEDGAILALFADLAFRPAAAAQDVETVLGGLARGTADTVQSLLRAA